MKMHSTESRFVRTEKYFVFSHVYALFSLEVLHAGAVKGLKDGFHWTAGVIHSTSLVTSTPDYLSACDYHA